MKSKFSAANRCCLIATSLLAALTAGCERKLTEAQKKARDEGLMEYLGPHPGAVHTFLAGPNDQTDEPSIDIGADSGEPGHLLVVLPAERASAGQSVTSPGDPPPRPIVRFELLVRDGRLLRREPLEDRVLLEGPLEVGAKPWYHYLPEIRKLQGGPLMDTSCRVTAVQRKEVAEIYTDTVQVTCDQPVPGEDIVVRQMFTLAKGLGIIEQTNGMARPNSSSYEPGREGEHRRLIKVGRGAAP